MKKSRICLFIIFILAVSCTKSRFATTTRHYHDGKATYTNHYSRESTNLNRHKTKRTATPAQASSAKTAGNPVDTPDAFNEMNPIVSSDKNFLILNNCERLTSQYTPGNYPEFQNEKEVTQSEHPWNTLTKDLATVAIKEIFQGDDTTVKKRDDRKENAAGIKNADNRKTEKLGLAGFILSFLGIIPAIGIPFALLAIIFGAKSLKKIKRHPEKYKGKGYAIASIAIGCVMLVFNIVLIVASSNWTTDPNPNHDPKIDCS